MDCRLHARYGATTALSPANPNTKSHSDWPIPRFGASVIALPRRARGNICFFLGLGTLAWGFPCHFINGTSSLIFRPLDKSASPCLRVRFWRQTLRIFYLSLRPLAGYIFLARVFFQAAFCCRSQRWAFSKRSRDHCPSSFRSWDSGRKSAWLSSRSCSYRRF